MNCSIQSPAFTAVIAAVLYLQVPNVYASSAGIEMLLISVMFYLGVLPALTIGTISALYKKGTYIFSLSASILVTLLILIGWACLAWWKNQGPGFLHHLEWPFKLIPFTIIPAIITNTISYWVIFWLRYIIQRRTYT